MGRYFVPSNGGMGWGGVKGTSVERDGMGEEGGSGEGGWEKGVLGEIGYAVEKGKSKMVERRNITMDSPIDVRGKNGGKTKGE